MVDEWFGGICEGYSSEEWLIHTADDRQCQWMVSHEWMQMVMNGWLVMNG